jgi:pyruvate carboxylase
VVAVRTRLRRVSNISSSFLTSAFSRRRIFFFGLETGEEVTIDIEPGKTLIIKLLTVSDAHADGTRTVFFELNGQPREITVADQSIEATGEAAVKADPAIAGQVGATMPGMVVTVAVQRWVIASRRDRSCWLWKP